MTEENAVEVKRKDQWKILLRIGDNLLPFLKVILLSYYFGCGWKSNMG